MATKTGGTKATTSLTTLQWQPGNISVADLATINELMRNPGDAASLPDSCRIENGLLYLPRNKSIIQLNPGDWIMVDANGWPIVIPNVDMISMSPATSWTHS